MRSNTYTQIYIHVIFAVKGRGSLLSENWEENLYKYTNGIITHKGQKPLAINGAYDHIHFLIGMKPTCCLSDLVREIKKSTNAWINGNKLTQTPFAWQEGFGTFSNSHADLGSVISYINNQKEHHKKFSFKNEYFGILKNFAVAYNDDYLFEWMDD